MLFHIAHKFVVIPARHTHINIVIPGDKAVMPDTAENCAAARALGIDAVLVERNALWEGMFD